MNQSANRGVLDLVGLLELLTMLGRKRQSGSLTLTSREQSISLAIVNGSVCSVSTDDPALRIGQILIRLEQTTEEQIEQALALQTIATDPDRIGEVLVDVGYITEADVGTAMATQIALALGMMFNEGRPAFEFTSWERPPEHALHPEIVNDPLVLTVLYLAEHWMQRNGLVTRTSYDPSSFLLIRNLEPGAHLLHQRCDELYALAAEASSSPKFPDAPRIRRNLAAILDSLRLHEMYGEIQPSRSGKMHSAIRPEYCVYLIDETIDIWSLTDLTRPARQLLLHLLNGEDRLENLLSGLRSFTEQPDRAVRELSSAGLIRIAAVEQQESQSRPETPKRRDKTVIYRFLP